jgi:hypothetical protein
VEKIKQKLHTYLYLDAWQRWEYKHTTQVLIGLAVFILLLNTSFMTTAFDLVGALGYFGVFLTGILFVSLFTAVPAFLLLLSFGELNPIAVALIAGLGSMIGDYLILKYAEEKVAYELKPIAFRFGIPQTIGYLQGKKSTLGLVRLLGAVIIASPLPDEIGIGLLGMGRLNRVNFLAICYVLNAAGILLIVLSARAL